MDQYRRGELVFDVIDAGLTDGPVVILLHGFPQMNTSWDAVIPKLTLGAIAVSHLTSGVTPAAHDRHAAGITGCPNWLGTSAR